MNDCAEALPEPGDRVGLLFSTTYVEGMQPGYRGTVAAVDGSGTIHVLWDNGTEQELRPCVEPYRLLTRAFSTKVHGGGRLVMRLFDDKSKAAGMPKPGDRVQFRFSHVHAHSGVWPGNKGTVDAVDKRGNIHVLWDNGAETTLVASWDIYDILPKEKGEGRGKAG